MRQLLILVLAAAGCSTPARHHFDEVQFKSVAARTVYAMFRTAPVELQSKMPLAEMRSICGSFPYPPDESKAQLLSILTQASYDDPLWKHIPASGDAEIRAGYESMRVRQSQKTASLIYQDCVNEYTFIHSGKTKPIKL